MGRWRRYRRLPPQARGLLLCALMMLPFTAVALRLLGFRRWRAALARLVPAPAEQEPQNSRARAALTARMVRAASREGLRRANCLEQSLVLWWLLRRQDLAAELRIGVRKQAARFEAHAWVVHDGLVLNDSEDIHRHYSPFDRSIVAAQTEPQ